MGVNETIWSREILKLKTDDRMRYEKRLDYSGLK